MSKETDFAAALVREKNARIAELEATNAELLEALERCAAMLKAFKIHCVEREQAAAAIAKARGNPA